MLYVVAKALFSYIALVTQVESRRGGSTTKAVGVNPAMMMVDTVLKPSEIHGIGVFLAAPVTKGTLLWCFDSRIDRVYCEEEIVSLPTLTQQFLRTYSTWNSAVKLWVLCGDNGRHFNHSADPNSISDGIAFGCDYAAADLPAGTELTSDYSTICDQVRLNGHDYGSGSNQPSEDSRPISSAVREPMSSR